MRRARTKHLLQQLKLPENRRIAFDEEGGDGFDQTRPPDPRCTECNGIGQWISRPIDFDRLSPGAAALFDGLRVRKDGAIEVKVRDRKRGLEMFVTLTAMLPRAGQQINIANIANIAALSDEQLDALIVRLTSSLPAEERAAQTAQLRTPLEVEDMRSLLPNLEDADL